MELVMVMVRELVMELVMVMVREVVRELVMVMVMVREVPLQGNRLTVLPPSLGSLDFLSSRSILKLDNNPWVGTCHLHIPPAHTTCTYHV